MIRENQTLFNRINVFTDGLLLYLSLPVAFWVRFYLLPGGIISVPLEQYLRMGVLLMLAHLLIYAAMGLYDSFRRASLKKELFRLCLTGLIVAALLLSLLFISHEVNYSRITMALYFLLSTGLLGGKRIILRLTLRHLRQAGYNQKHILLLGSGKTARAYLDAISAQRQLGYQCAGYVAEQPADGWTCPHLGSYDRLDSLLDQLQPDEVVAAVDAQEQHRIPQIIAACEKAGIRLSIIPFYAQYVTSSPEFDKIGDLPLLNIRHIPLENWGNAFCKRLMDVLGSLALIILTAPIMLVCAMGVRLSSPGPILFRQQRVGRNNKCFYMYKFRSMRLNSEQDTRWSTNRDDRKTPFGAFLRKYSLDEFPQFFNVLKGDMSLVGPRPELPHFVNQFKEEIPLYMVKHQVRPGITGWAQVNDLRGDTSITARVEHDIYYIEHWSLLFDIKILLATVFKGKFKNSETLR